MSVETGIFILLALLSYMHIAHRVRMCNAEDRIADLEKKLKNK